MRWEQGRSRGFGFVTYRDPDCVKKVLVGGPHIIDGRQVSNKDIFGPLLDALGFCRSTRRCVVQRELFKKYIRRQ